jgi:hypothetical protein
MILSFLLKRIADQLPAAVYRVDKQNSKCVIFTLSIIQSNFEYDMDEIPDAIPDEIRTSRGLCNTMADKTLPIPTSTP